MWATQVLQTSRTTYRGVRGSGAGQSLKTAARSSSASRPTQAAAVLSGQVFKRSQRGLFDGALPQSGNVIPKSRQKTARTWRPNVQFKTVWSDILQRNIKTHVTTKAMRTMKKMGGLDAYLAQRDDRLLGAFGRSLRNEVGGVVREQVEQGVTMSELRQRIYKIRKADLAVKAARTKKEKPTETSHITNDAVNSELDRMALELQSKATLQDRIGDAAATEGVQQQQQP